MNIKKYLAFCIILLLFACEDKTNQQELTEVIVDSVKNMEYKPSNAIIGKLRASDDIEIKANVTGYLKSRTFTEGDYVEEGSPLFTIDPAPFRAELAQANADLSRVVALKKVATLNYQRGLELHPKGAISASEMDKLTAAKLEAEADLEGAKAKVVKAEVNLDYTSIKAPFSGQIGRSEYSVGDLVSGQGEPLTTLVNADPMKIIFQISEAVYLNFANREAELKKQGKPEQDFNLTIQLSNGSMYSEVGKIDYIANRVSEETGTVEGRALIANPDNLLKPGQYVRVHFESTTSINALFIPQASIQADQQGSFVLSVGPDNMVKRLNVNLGQRVGENVVVTQGLTGNEDVIVRGLQLVRPGQRVNTKHISSAKANSQ